MRTQENECHTAGAAFDSRIPVSNAVLQRMEKGLLKAREKGDMLTVVRIKQDIDRIHEMRLAQERLTMKEALKDYNREDLNEATAMVIYAIVTADILCGATMDLEEVMRKRFDIDGLPVFDKLRNITAELQKVVRTIDNVGSGVLSERYADMVSEIETRYSATMKNYIYNEVMKWSRKGTGNA